MHSRTLRRRWSTQLLAGALASATILLLASHAQAQTLTEAMAQAYSSNPQLSAQQARLRRTDELVPQAVSGWRPRLRSFGEIGKRRISGDEKEFFVQQRELTPRSVSAELVQPVFQGGETLARTRAAENTVRAERFRLLAVEQNVLVNTAIVYMDVYRDQSVLELNVKNEQRIMRQLDAARDRFAVGEVTRTDVSQAEARLARATAERITAEGELANSRAAYRTVVGDLPGALDKPPLPDELPRDLRAAQTLALNNNPNVVLAEYTERAALDDVDVARADLLPTVDLIGSAERELEGSRSNGRIDTYEAQVRLTVPIYTNGSSYSVLRQSKQAVTEQRRRVDQAQRQSTEDVTTAWSDLATAVAEVGQFEKEIVANGAALEGVEAEASVGARTVLDILDAEQALLDSQVSLVRAQRDLIVAGYTLKAAVGQMSAELLGLPVKLYNPLEHYDEVRDAWFGTSSIGGSDEDFDAKPGRD